MGTIDSHRPVLLIAAVTSQFDEAFDWGLSKSEQTWGPIWGRSDLFDFSETSYYEKSMGKSLKKQFWAFDRMPDPSGLADWKRLSNEWEEEFRRQFPSAVERPINIDPGYITEAKLVLGTTKDRDHRIYLGKGIYAEVTLHFNRGEWKTRSWTYPDYQRVDFQEFFTACRDELRTRYKSQSAARLTGEDIQ